MADIAFEKDLSVAETGIEGLTSFITEYTSGMKSAFSPRSNASNASFAVCIP